MSKPIIKIIKRKDVEASAKAETQHPQSAPSAARRDAARTARRLQRETAAAISKWIPEQRNKRLEEVSAVRQFFGSDLLLSKI